MSVETGGMALVATLDADGTSIIKGPPTPEPTQPYPTLVPSAPSGVVAVAPPVPIKWSSDEAVAQADLPDVPFRFSEKKRLHWSDKTCMWSHSGSHLG